jgi:hypothetical protein
MSDAVNYAYCKVCGKAFEDCSDADGWLDNEGAAARCEHDGGQHIIDVFEARLNGERGEGHQQGRQAAPGNGKPMIGRHGWLIGWG